MSTNIEKNVDLLRDLDKRKKLIMEYFLRNISVGDIIAVVDLKEEIKKRVRQGEKDLVGELDDAIITRELLIDIDYLIRKGLVEHREGVYKLSNWLIEEIKKRKKRASPGVVKSIQDLLANP